MDTLTFDPIRKSLVFKTGYDPDLVEDIKSIPGRLWNKYSRDWTVPTTEVAAAIRVAREYGIHITDEVMAMSGKLKEAHELSAAVAHEATDNITIPGLSDKAQLRPYQKVGVAYLASKRRAILADEMGTGKTLQSLCTVAATNAWPAVVVCPASLRINWQREAQQWFPDKKAAVIGLGGGKKRDQEILNAKDADIIILNYDIAKDVLPALQDAGIEPKALICDEAHYVKDLKSQRGMAIQDMAHDLTQRRDSVVILATGTPVINRPADLIAPLKIMGNLNEFGGWKGFVTRYCNAKQTRWGWDISGASNIRELEQKLRATCYIRRTKDQVLQELPDKQRTAVEITLPPAALKAYADVEREFASWYRGFTDDNSAETLRRITALRQAVGQGKIEPTISFVKDIVDTGEKAIVFAIHKEVQDAILNGLRAEQLRVASITGEMESEQRQAAVDRFQYGQADVIVCSQKAAGTGLTLTAASNVVFAEYDWTAASHDQAEDRAHRLGQKNAVNVWYIHAAGTIDDAMAQTVEYKRKIAHRVAGDRDAGDLETSREDIARVLASIASRQGGLEKEKKKAKIDNEQQQKAEQQKAEMQQDAEAEKEKPRSRARVSAELEL